MKEGDLSLFKNDKKTPGSNQPDMRGKLMINGQIYKISAWTKGTGESKFLSGKVEVDDYVKPEQNAPAQQVQDDNDSLPF